MKKKSTKIVVMILVVVLVLSFTSTAFAESISYDGKCYNDFFASRTLTKRNDTRLTNHTSNISNVTLGGETGAFCDSKIYIAGVVRGVKYNMQPTSRHYFTDSDRKYLGTCQVQLINSSNNPTGHQIRVIGTFSIDP